MNKRNRIFKKPRDGDVIKTTSRQLQQLLEHRSGRLNSRDYRNLALVELQPAPPRDAIWALRQYDDETLLGVFNKTELGRGKRIYIRVESEDEQKYYCSVSYIPRALNNRDVNDAIVRLYFVRKWSVTKKMLFAEPVDIKSSH